MGISLILLAVAFFLMVPTVPGNVETSLLQNLIKGGELVGTFSAVCPSSYLQ